MHGVSLAVFHVSHQLVVPELVTAFHELVQFHDGTLFGCKDGFAAESPAFAVEVVQCGAYRLLVRLSAVVRHHLTDGFLFGNTALEALLTYGDKQRMEAVTTAPVLRIVKGSVQRGLKQQGESLRGLETRFQPFQGISLRQPVLAECLFAGHRHGLL